MVLVYCITFTIFISFCFVMFSLSAVHVFIFIFSFCFRDGENQFITSQFEDLRNLDVTDIYIGISGMIDQLD